MVPASPHSRDTLSRGCGPDAGRGRDADARIRHGGKKKWGEVTIQRLDKDS